MLMAGYWSIND